MRRAATIARRELSSYFFTPVAYVALTLFLWATAVAFWDDFRPGNPAQMRNLFQWMVWILVIIVPKLTMGLIAQEWSTGTMEPMTTAPVNEADVVLGKFLGSLTFFGILLAPTLIYAAMLSHYGHTDKGEIACGYFGIVLVGALFISVGLFFSSLTRSQMVAADTTTAALALITFLPWWAKTKFVLPQFWNGVANQFVDGRYSRFAMGFIDSDNVVFFILATGVFLFLTMKVLEMRRWA